MAAGSLLLLVSKLEVLRVLEELGAGSSRGVARGRLDGEVWLQLEVSTIAKFENSRKHLTREKTRS